MMVSRLSFMRERRLGSKVGELGYFLRQRLPSQCRVTATGLSLPWLWRSATVKSCSWCRPSSLQAERNISMFSLSAHWLLAGSFTLLIMQGWILFKRLLRR